MKPEEFVAALRLVAIWVFTVGGVGATAVCVVWFGQTVLNG